MQAAQSKMNNKKAQFKWKIAALLLAIASLVIILLLISDVGDVAKETARKLAGQLLSPG